MGICFFWRFRKKQIRRPPKTNAAMKQTYILRLFSACSQALNLGAKWAQNPGFLGSNRGTADE
ncbi:MAG: hypothetical protein DMG35_08990 [Acidobacteria bacterium]|nr:MAG: hypothetical protein DMG35_08990 [Acidobacteriota bacterium]PYU07888.1 MAG: hypothetical protein DMG33_03465 [Acidobacteriota bacterium]